MTHCADCHKEIEGMAKHIPNCVKTDIDCSVCHIPEIDIQGQIRKVISEKGKIEYAEGIFGDVNQNLAYFSEKTHTEKGQCYRILGCSYLYPNTLLGPVHDACTSLKRTLMATLRFVFKCWWIFSPLALIFYKPIVRAFVYWFADIYESDLKQKTYKFLSEFAPTPREMIRAGLVLADRIPLKGLVDNFEKQYGQQYTAIRLEYANNGDDWDRKEFEGIATQEYRTRVRRFVWGIGTFIQSDSAYRLRSQDGLSNLNKVSLKENPRKEILRLFDLVMSRENTIRHKVGQLRKLASALLLFPPILKIAYDYFNELDVSQFQPDEADRYFVARIQGYNFEGKGIEERRAWADEIDLEKGHTILKT